MPQLKHSFLHWIFEIHDDIMTFHSNWPVTRLWNVQTTVLQLTKFRTHRWLLLQTSCKVLEYTGNPGPDWTYKWRGRPQNLPVLHSRAVFCFDEMNKPPKKCSLFEDRWTAQNYVTWYWTNPRASPHYFANRVATRDQTAIHQIILL